MFCSECGTKNDKKAKFCEACGHALEKQKKPPKEKRPNPVMEALRSLSSKTKKFILVFLLLVLIFVGSFFLLGHLTSSSYVANSYFEALSSYDAKKLSSFLDLEESCFTSKKILQQLLDREKEGSEKIINYKLIQNVASSDGLRRTVTFSYMTNKSSSTKKATVTLLKKKQKKWLFFDDWAIQNNQFQTVSDIELNVIKGSEVTIEGIKLKPEWRDASKSDETFDVYSLPTMLEADYQVKAVLPNGITLENTLAIDGYHKSYSLELNKEDLSDSLLGQIKELSKTSLNQIYASAIQKQPFANIQEKFQYDGGDLTELATTYQTLIKDLEASNVTLVGMNITDVVVEDVELTKEGQLYVSLKVNYDDQITYLNESNQTVEHSSKDYGYVNVTFDWSLETLHFVNAKNLITRFSKYF